MRSCRVLALTLVAACAGSRRARLLRRLQTRLHRPLPRLAPRPSIPTSRSSATSWPWSANRPPTTSRRWRSRRSSSAFSRSSIPTLAPTSSHLRTGGGGRRRGLPDLHDAPGRAAREGGQDARRLRQDRRHAQPHAVDAGSPAGAPQLLGGDDALADAGLSFSRLIRSRACSSRRRPVFRGESAVFQAPARGDLAYVGHLRAYRDLSESTNLDLGGSFAYGHNGAADDTTTRLIGADLTFRYKPLRRAIYRSLILRQRAGLEPARGCGRTRPRRVRRLRLHRVPALATPHRRPALRQLGTRGGRQAARSRRLLRAHLSAQRVQPVAGQYRRMELAEGRTATTSCFSCSS